MKLSLTVLAIISNLGIPYAYQFALWLFDFQFISFMIAWEKAVEDDQGIWALPLTWETQVKLLVLAST